MFLGIIIIVCSLIAIAYGIIKRNEALIIAAITVLTIIVTIALYFFMNPY